MSIGHGFGGVILREARQYSALTILELVGEAEWILVALEAADKCAHRNVRRLNCC